MILVSVLLMLQQGAVGGPTVGDTIWVRRAIAVPAGSTVRAPQWAPDGDVELLGTPVIETRGDSATLRFPIVAWTAGDHRVRIPGATLLRPDGGVDTLPATEVSFRVRSVLPEVASDRLQAQPPASLVARSGVSFVAVAVALGVAALLVGLMQWWWRRRGTTPPQVAREAPAEVPASEWANAGERRAVLAHASAALRAAIEGREPAAHRGLDTAHLIARLRPREDTWPLADIASVLGDLDAARFAPESAVPAQPLYDRAIALAHQLAGDES